MAKRNYTTDELAKIIIDEISLISSNGFKVQPTYWTIESLNQKTKEVKEHIEQNTFENAFLSILLYIKNKNSFMLRITCGTESNKSFSTITFIRKSGGEIKIKRA